MTVTTWSGHLLGPDVHASRPAAASVPDGSLYSCTTHNKLYKVVSGAWSDYASLGGAGVATDTIFDAKGDLVVGTAADTSARLAVGSNNQVLVADSAQTTGVKWAAAPGGAYIATDTLWDAKGDLAVATAADTGARLAVGTDGQVLTADSTQTTGIKWAAAAGSGNWTLLSDQSLGADASTIDFTSISGSYILLKLLVSARSSLAGNATDEMMYRLNNDSGANYLYQRLYANNAGGGSSVMSSGNSVSRVGWIPANTATSNYFGGCEITFYDYANTSRNKVSLSQAIAIDTSSDGFISGYGGMWLSTAAITRITLGLFGGAGQFRSGSRATLYGLN